MPEDPLDHPDDDALADWSAGLLTPEETAVVEQHIIECARCGDLLEAAESVPRRLAQLPDERMPAGLVAGFEASVLAAVTSTSAPTPAATPVSGTRAEPDDAAGGAASTGPSTGPTRVLRPMATATGAGTGTGARRQQRSEERTEERTFRWLGYGRIAAIVVGVLVLGAGGVAGLRAITGGDGTAEYASSAGGAADDAAPLVTVVLATGTDYTSADVKKQVESLVAESRKSPSAAARAYSPTSSQEGSATDLQTSTAPSASAWSTATVKSCLTAIGRADEQPVAVDLATYESREAAAIVLQEPDGTYEVWFVSRTCGTGSQETFAVETITP
ncbi:hypothetical protein ACIB24_02875 [Spongisporangium articulatum]|uniref:Zinc-finger domain-containing protein n=1 Tax=Spongisporangium articulatum TaxID=3362603 RepID=A0ABW8AI25_9ACTN